MPHALLLSPDDQAVNAITGVLEEMSVTYERPLDGVTAAHKLNACTFDLVLVDCENLAAAKLILDVCRRRNSAHNPVPIAIVDGGAGLPTAFRLGAELILTKPVAKDQARSTIRTAASRVRKDVPADENAAQVPSETSAHKASETNNEAHGQAVAAACAQAPSVAEPVFSSAPSSAASAGLATGAPLLGEVETTGQKTFHTPDLPTPSPFEDQAGVDESIAESDGTDSSSNSRLWQKTSPSLIALLVLVLAVGGVDAAWTYQPGFRAMAQPQIDRVLLLVGMAPLAAPSSTPAKPATRMAPAAVPPRTQPSDPNKMPATTSGSTSGSAIGGATGATATDGPTAVPAQVEPNPRGAVAPSVSASATTTTMPGDKLDNKKDNVAAAPSNTLLPGEDSAVILSSKGAEERLTYSVAPKYPVEARAEASEGTVVLKADQ